MADNDPRPTPRTTLIAVLSLDGCLTKGDQPGVGFASDADQAWFRKSLRAFDVALMGRETYEVARPVISRSTSARQGPLRVVMTRNPAAYQAEAVPGALEFTDQPPNELLARLYREGHRHAVLLGGSVINRLFLEIDRVDRLWLTLEPTVFGSGRRLVDRAIEARFEFASFEHLAPSTLLLKYRRPEAR